MDDLKSQRNHPFDTTFDHSADSRQREDWEDWEDDGPVTVFYNGDDSLLESTAENPSKSTTKSTRITQPRVSTTRPSALSRLKSRRRQKAQNAKAGIKLETDMSKFRPDHIAFQMKPGFETAESRRGRFVDAAALKALEGEPSTSTVGSFHWLRRKPSQASKGKAAMPKTVRTPVGQDLSPNDRPIVIGFALPEGSHADISPQTAIVRTPDDFPIIQPYDYPHNLPITAIQFTQQHQQQQSVWSPDTEDGYSPFQASAATSSIYSQPNRGGQQDNVPPMPPLPSNLKGRSRATTLADDDEDEDAGTPVTLFEEDGSPVATHKSLGAGGKTQSPATTIRRSRGWWDAVTSPFTPSTPFTTSPDTIGPGHSPASIFWKGSPAKEPLPSGKVPGPLSIVTQEVPQRRVTPELVVGASSPTIASSRSRQGSSRPEPRSEKGLVLAEEPQYPGEEPPPYSPPSNEQQVRYRAVFPPGHPLNTLSAPSPGPMSPGLAGTMTSQGAITMTDVPLTPPPREVGAGAGPLPNRPLGSFVPGDHYFEVAGRGPRQKAERQRRRHEKEDAVARKVGGLWKGRGCIPANGCYGRPGREGRKRRRMCLGVAAGVIASIILIVVLVVTLAHPRRSDPGPSDQWLNLTAFPPIPTGVLTVVGPDNSQAVTACIQPSTLWSCSLPKEQADAAAPFRPTQPKFIFQIQFDNSSSQKWNVPNEAPPRAGGAHKARGTAARRARALLRRASQRSDSKFAPDPAPPSFREMWFLGNTTDGIQSDQKAGEPTPFYISLLRSVNESVGPDVLERRFVYNVSNFPAPDRYLNGTGAPATLFPLPTQQPLRLYDRGLPTEHYGFYSYYDKSIYVKSKSALDQSTAGQGEVPADLNGGALETEANFQVVWGQTRFKVEIWTRMSGITRLVGGGADNPTTTTTSRPGTLPYPVTVTLDKHGGDARRKGTVWYPVDDRQRIDTSHLGDENVILYNLGFNGPWINPPDASADPSLGGFDGGTGGCKCEYTNFIVQNGQ
ncbi:hypothetical protein QBC33DRAFT_557017 [Phialemonium atrogriseum]|uniref:Glycoprotease family protein n=1 Tax=Phialemonium atrogriseum TaxID=1093897 RepID=A0AAJ0C6Q5_9PEZI|nr:uncharacterized protein QBC33DRAFT_557017 [Phialemonium atrogriseum]KAK1769732.1 hypothetical protein QBC33DRAFT_557017 [Phialemonium atrogriseum]